MTNYNINVDLGNEVFGEMITLDEVKMMTGSEKQIEWANKIQQTAIEDINYFVSQHIIRGRRAFEMGKMTEAQFENTLAKLNSDVETYKTRLMEKTEAKWWIDRRDHTAQEWMTEVR